MAYSDVQKVLTNLPFAPGADPSNVTFWIIPEGGIADVDSPTPAEINAGLNATDAIRIDGFDFGPEESDAVDDRSFGDHASAQYSGFAQFGGSVPAYEPKPGDVTSVAYQVKEIMGRPRSVFYWVERIADGKTKADVAAAGDYVSVYKVITGGHQRDTSDRNLGIIYSVTLLPQGDVAINAMVKTATTPTYAPTTLALDIGEAGIVKATLSTRDITRGGQWVSSAPTIASVSPNGVVVGLSAGTATITTLYAAATGAGTGTAVTVS